MDYTARMTEARKLIDQGMYSQAVMTLGNVLENLYADFYQDILAALPPAQRQILTQREGEFAASGDKLARERGFSGLTLGGKSRFFFDNKVVEEGERILNRAFPHFRAFDARLFTGIRNRITHEGDADVTEDEADLFYRQMRVLLLEVGYLHRPQTGPLTPETISGLHSWKENGVIPHQDILDGNLRMDTYAADLWGVARNDQNTPEVYRDARKFFEQTYLTRNLHGLLKDVLGALAGGAGDRVLQLRTPFGGGKTHALIALYHVARQRDALASDRAMRDMLADLPDPGPCAVAAIQCEKFGARTGRHTEDGLHIRTLWGEVAYQLAGAEGYAYFQEYDEGYTAPGGEMIAALLRDLGHPALILLDEVLNHVEAAQTITVGESTLGRQLMVFLKALTEAVSTSPKVALVYSLQKSIGEALGAEVLLDTLDSLVSRVDAKREPVTGQEVMNVVQRRLFQSLGDENVRRTVASAYAEAYRRARMASGGLSGDDQRRVAQEAAQVAERILQSYPIHPDLLDLMYHRWGSLPSYQRTRGALQFLASAVYDLWHTGRDLQPLIGPGDVPLESDHTRNAFFSQVGQREQYAGVMDADLTGLNARAKSVDAHMAADSPALQRYRIGTRLATAAMLYSFGAREGEDRGVSEADLLAATLAPGLDRLSLTTALNDLRNAMLYLHFTGRRYRFETVANLNKLIEDEKKKFSAEDVYGLIKSTLDAVLRGVDGVVVWPESSARVNDLVPQLQVVFLRLDWATVADDAELHARLTEWLEYCGNVRRQYKNGLAFALPGYMQADSLSSVAREVLAIQSLAREKRRANPNDPQLAELKRRSDESGDRLTNGVVSLYERVAVPVQSGEGAVSPFEWRLLDLQSRGEGTPYERVLGALRGAHLVFDTLTADKLVALTDLTGRRVVRTGPTVDLFFGTYSFVRLLSSRAIQEAIARGVADGKFGYSAVVKVEGDNVSFPQPDLIYIGRPLRTDEIDLNQAFLLERSWATELTEPDTPPAPPTPPIEPTPSVGPQPPIGPTPPSPKKSTRYTLTATVNKQKAFRVFTAINNLADRSDELMVQVSLEASAAGGFDRVWLRNAVEEPLDEADIEAETKLE